MTRKNSTAYDETTLCNINVTTKFNSAVVCCQKIFLNNKFTNQIATDVQEKINKKNTKNYVLNLSLRLTAVFGAVKFKGQSLTFSIKV